MYGFPPSSSSLDYHPSSLCLTACGHRHNSSLIITTIFTINQGVVLYSPNSSSKMRQCGVKELSEPEVLSLEKKKRAILNHRRKKRDEAIVIDVHFHVITSSSGGGALSESSIDEQMEVLNAAFNPHFMFLKRSVETVENDDWFVMGMGTSSEIMVKSSLRIGTGEELNIYTAELTDDLLGW